jgi:hypothetical protein
MKFLSLFLLLTSPLWARFDRSFDAYKLSPGADSFSGVKFPRNGQPLYRGNPEVQFDKIRATAAMLGSDEPVESILFSALKLALMKERVSFYSTVRPMYEARGYDASVVVALRANDDKPYSLKEARKKAFQIMETEMWARHKSGAFYNSYVDYKSYALEIFPQDVIFSSTYLEVANIYSRFITVFDDSIQPSMLDLNYWNKVRHGDWTFTVKKWIDKGEFICPIAIDAEKVQGFMEYLSQVPNYHIFRVLPNHLDLAFMRITVGSDPYVLVFDGQEVGKLGAPAILKHNGAFYLADTQFEPDADIPKNLKKRDQLAPLMGAFKLCSKDEDCKMPMKVFANYPRSARRLDSSVINSIEAYDIRSKSPKFFSEPSKETEEKAKEEEKPKEEKKIPRLSFEAIVKATNFKPVITAEKVKTKTDTTLFYEFAGWKLAPGGAIYIKLPAEFHGKKIASVNIVQRQDPKDNSTKNNGNYDKSPAYTAVEFYAASEGEKDPWRYWGGTSKFKNPKGSLFANISATPDSSGQILSDWTVMKGHDTDAVLEDTDYSAVRLIGVGTDPSVIHGLYISFE